ncbi:hypothetical protein ACFE04_015886 [Oxalis oulophora]
MSLLQAAASLSNPHHLHHHLHSQFLCICPLKPTAGTTGRRYTPTSYPIIRADLDQNTCRFCVGAGTVSVELGGGENEISSCINCDGAGTLTCTTCQGSGIQPRYLDRRTYSRHGKLHLNAPNCIHCPPVFTAVARVPDGKDEPIPTSEKLVMKQEAGGWAEIKDFRER